MMEDRRPLTTSKPAVPSPQPQSPAAPPDIKSPSSSRPLYSSKLSEPKGRSSESSGNSNSSSNQRQPPVPQKAWTSSRNPITGRSQTPRNGLNFQNRNSATYSLREGQKVRITLNNGSEFEGFYENHPTDPSTCYLKMAQQRKGPNSGDVANGTARRESNVPFQRRDIADARALPSNPNNNKNEGKTPNGSRSFRTDTAISNNRPGSERTLKPWVPDNDDGIDGSLESSASTAHGGRWDQFAENERRFGIRTDYDENIYTTAIDKSHPQYHQRLAAADKKAREIERSAPTTAHVAEERVMDYVEGQDQRDEEEKYSGVRRQDFPPLSNRESNKYTPPARRAPQGHSTVKGAPVDPAIISSQLKPSQKQQNQKSDGVKAGLTYSKVATASAPDAKAGEQADSKPTQSSRNEAGAGDTKAPSDSKASNDKTSSSLRPSGPSSRTISPQAKDGGSGASSGTTLAVEHAVLKDFKTFASQERQNAEKVRSNKAKADKEVRLIELKKFANNFKLSTPVPSDLITIIAKDPERQKEIQAKALQNAELIAKRKAVVDVPPAPKEKSGAPAKGAAQQQPRQPPAESTSHASGFAATSTTAPTTTAATANSAAASAPTPAEHRNNNSRANAQQHSGPSGPPNRHPAARQSYNAQPHYHTNYRNNRAPHLAPQNQPTGNLAHRIREQQQKMHHPQHPPHLNQHGPNDSMRIPPTGPANNTADQGFGRRPGAMPPPHLTPAKLNPNSHEFRPNAFAPAFNPAGPSQGSSPRSSVNNVVEAQPVPAPIPAPTPGQLIRRKTQAIDVKKCFILSHIKSIQPPQGRHWDDNDGLRPSFDTLPTWRQLQEETEKPDSTMHLTYKEYFEKLPLSGAAMATPNPSHVMPQLAHQHQLPFHLQHNPHNPHNPGLRQSPHMPPIPVHSGQPPHAPHAPFTSGDDQRMVHSTSAQSFTSPRMNQVPMNYPPSMNSPAQMQYNQPVMHPYMNPNAPQLRSYSNNPQFMPQQPPHMGGHIMMQPQFIGGPNGMVPGGSHVPMYPGGHPQFMPPGAAPPQPMGGGSSGFPSPGRPAAPMMAHQGSHQGQPMYGMSPGVQYQQPAFNNQPPRSGQRPQ